MWLVKCVTKPRFGTPCDSQHVKQSEKLHHSTSSFITLAEVELENVRLSVSEILEVFITTLNADDKYSLRNRKNLPHSFQLQLSKKQKISFESFATCLKSTSNFEDFKKRR